MSTCDALTAVQYIPGGIYSLSYFLRVYMFSVCIHFTEVTFKNKLLYSF